MIRHIVLWRFKDQAGGASREENLSRAVSLFEEILPKLTGVLHFSAGVNGPKSEEASDLALLVDFDSWNSLREYQDHPEHLRVVSFLRSVRTERRVVDFEL